MSNATQSTDKPSLTDVTTALESFVEATTAAVEAADVSASTSNKVAATGERLIDALTAHTDRIEELEGRIEELTEFKSGQHSIRSREQNRSYSPSRRLPRS